MPWQGEAAVAAAAGVRSFQTIIERRLLTTELDQGCQTHLASMNSEWCGDSLTSQIWSTASPSPLPTNSRSKTHGTSSREGSGTHGACFGGDLGPMAPGTSKMHILDSLAQCQTGWSKQHSPRPVRVGPVLDWVKQELHGHQG